MTESNQTIHILNTESQDQLIKSIEEERLKIFKLLFVFKELRKIQAVDLDLMDGGAQVEKALQILKIKPYLQLNKTDCLLNLQDCCHIKLNYIERKALRQRLSNDLENTLKPIAVFGRKLRTEFPHLFVKNTNSTMCSTDIPQSSHEQIITLETKRRSNFEKLADIRNEKCSLLNIVAEIKNGPYLANELEVLYANARHNHIKANVLRDCFINELCSRSEYSVNAINEVEKYIKEKVDQNDED